MTSILDINKLNIISDDNYYYFFRALNNDDHQDLESNNGKINAIRTDLSRFTGYPNYSPNSSISLEEVNDHIKWCHTKDTNCISLSSNANVIATYGRSNYHDEYVIVKVRKDEIDKNVFLAVDYIASEVEKRIKSITDISDTQKYYLDFIDNITTDIQLEQFKKNIKNDYKITDATDASTLDKSSFLKLKKLILKLDILGKPISPKISNRTLIETIKFAYSSSEFIHYKEIPKEKVTRISSELLDIFSLLQQVPNNEEIDEIKKELLTKLDSLDTYNYNTSTLDEKEYSVSNMYKLSNGSIDYGTIKDIVTKAYYLAKSRLRTKNAIDKLNILLGNNSKYSKVLDNLRDNAYGIEPEISSRLNSSNLFLSESVSLNIDESEKKLLDLINNLSDDQLVNVVENKEGFLLSILDNYINTEYENISGYKKEPVSENEYYVEAILNSIDINSIYPNSIKDKKLTKDEKFVICNKLYKGNCKNLYNAFLKAGVEKNKIPYYIINLYLSNGYKGYNFYDFSVLPELDEIIAKNITNLNYKISALDFDNLREIKDDHNIIEGTNINLRDYQKNTINNIKELYKTKRFAGVVLPTGAGKSFIAITTMLEYQNKNIVYIAPNVGINRQVQRHIIKNVIGYKKTYEEIAKMLEDPNKYEMYIKQYFPYLKFYCYQGMSNKEQEELANLDADLIVLDELHRTGASTWSKSISDLIQKNNNAKVLGLTATPVRTDGEDMTRSIAKLTNDYSEKELMLDKHLAVNMNLIDAIRDDIVVSPRIVSFDYNLVNSNEYEEIKEKYEKETDPEKKEEFKKIYDKMIDILSKSRTTGLSKIIEDNLTDKYGKYLVFLPRMSSDYEGDSERYFKEEMDKFASNIANIDSNPIQRYIYSDKSNKENDKEIIDFELDESSHIKTLYAVDMLNEGIHVDNISGSFMFRPISSSKILYLQQLGRTVYSKDPDHNYTDEERPIVFDYYNNYFILNMDRMVNKTDATSDLERLKNIHEWINKHGFIPDINSQNITEARKAITLKKIKSKYIKYLDTNNLNELDEVKKNTIIEILEIANEIGLFGIDFPDRIIPPSEKKIDDNSTFELSATQKELIELVKESRKVGKSNITKESTKTRLHICFQVLDILDEYLYPINEKSLPIGMTLNILKTKLDDYAIEKLNDLGLPDEYPIGDEFNNLKIKFYYHNKMQIFEDLDLDTAIKYGLFTKFQMEGKVMSFLEGNIIRKGPKRFYGFNILTKEREFVEKHFTNAYDITKLLTILVDNGYPINNDTIPLTLTLKKLKEKLPKEIIEQIDELDLDDTFNVGLKYNDLKSIHYFNRNKDIFNELDLDTAIKYGLFEEFTGSNGNIRKFVKNDIIIKGHEKFIGYNIITKEKKTEKIDFIDSSKLIQLLDILSNSLFEINYKNIPPGMKLGELKLLLDKDTIDKIDALGLSDDYEIGNEYNYQKYLLYYRKNTKSFDDLDLETAIRLGLLNDFFYDGKMRSFVNNNFIEHGPDKFIGFNVLTSTKYGIDGYNYYGLDKNLFNRDHFYNNTNSLYDKNNFDYRGINKFTNTFLDPHQFDANGVWYDMIHNMPVCTYKTLNPGRFSIDGLYHPENSSAPLSRYNPEGYDIDGFDRNGYDKEGYDREGYDKNKFNRDKINKYTKKLFDRGGFNADRKLLVKKIVDGKEVIVERKINKYHFNADRLYCEKQPNGSYKVTNRFYSPDGFDYDGIHVSTGKRYNENFFDRDGFFWELVDGKRVRTTSKIDNHNFDKNGDFYELVDKELVNTHKKYDNYDFDFNGVYRFHSNTMYKEYNQRGFNIDHINRFTNEPYDRDFFDIDGFYWELIDGKRVKTDKKTNELGFDVKKNHWKKDANGNRTIPGDSFGDDGYDYDGYDRLGFDREHRFLGRTTKLYNDEGFDYRRIHKDTGKPYDLNFYKINNNFCGRRYYPSSYTNLITGTGCDIRGFDISGKTNVPVVFYCRGILEKYSSALLRKNDTYDYCNFDVNGIHKITKTMYDSNGYNAFRVDKDGLRVDGTKHPDIAFTEKYFDLVEKNIDPLTDKQINDYLVSVLKHIDYAITRDKLVKIIIYAACKMYPKIIDKIPYKLINDKDIKPEVVNIDEIIATSKLNMEKNPRLFISTQ